MSEKKALRYNDSKPKLSYFMRSFPRALEAVARVKEFGASKYSEGNWKLGGKPDEEYLDSLMRHLGDFLKGEKYDKDSGCHLLGHCLWNLCALLELNTDNDPLIDENLFRERMDHWAAEKEKREEDPDPCGPDCPGCGATDGSGCADCEHIEEKEEAMKALTQADVNEVMKELRKTICTEEKKGKPMPPGKKPRFIPYTPPTMKPSKRWEVEPTRESEWVDNLNNWIVEHRKEEPKDGVPPMPATHDEMMARLRDNPTPKPVNITFEIKDGKRSEVMDKFMAQYRDVLVASIQKSARQIVMEWGADHFFSRFDESGFYRFNSGCDDVSHKANKEFEV